MAVACQGVQGESTPPPAPRRALRIAHTWEDGGRFTAAFQSELDRLMPDVDVTLAYSAAGITNLSLLQRGEVDAVSTYADIAYMAMVGQLPAMDEPFGDLRAIAALPLRDLQVLVAPGSRIRGIHELRGRRVSLGPPGTGVAFTAALLLSAFGIGPGDIAAEHLAFDDAAEPLASGAIDAAFWGGRAPNPNIERVLSRGGRLLEIVGPEINRVRSEYPFLRASSIPPGTYPGVDGPVHTVGVDGLFACRADLDDRYVYNITHAFFRAVTEAGHHVRPLQRINVSRAAATPLPLHPGAGRYYREAEMRR